MELLMRDGRVKVEFSPDLSPPQCEELLEIVRRFSIQATALDLRNDVQDAAQRWGITVTVTRLVR
jgi:hypothetical protein